MNRQLGFTLIELLITITILGILAMAAFPSFQDMAERQRLKGAANEAYSLLVFARNQAVKNSRDIRVTFTAGDTWAFGLTDKAADCVPTDGLGDANPCTIDLDNDRVNTTDDLKLVRYTSNDYPGVSIDAAKTFLFDYRKGTASADTVTFRNSQGPKNVIVSVIGRARVK